MVCEKYSGEDNGQEVVCVEGERTGITSAYDDDVLPPIRRWQRYESHFTADWWSSRERSMTSSSESTKERRSKCTQGSILEAKPGCPSASLKG